MRIVAALTAVAALCLVFVASGSALDPSARGTVCAHADSTAKQATPRQLRKALGCLINVERAKRDRRLLKPNKDLARLAQRHTKRMVTENCFRHQCEGERTLRKRIEGSGYLASGGRYGYGENLGCSETPRGMVAVWMDNSFHRRNIVDGRFRHFGLGAKRGSPFPPGNTQCTRRYMTYTVIFGWRKPPAN